ncbi:hypothetical protein AB6B38_12690 [Glycocaulis abyssi]|uniref:hypothetical protein n=1 Tax=Glycocaulis abyssi TaxID=1433403 RepID=UPI00352A38D0
MIFKFFLMFIFVALSATAMEDASAYKFQGNNCNFVVILNEESERVRFASFLRLAFGDEIWIVNDFDASDFRAVSLTPTSGCSNSTGSIISDRVNDILWRYSDVEILSDSESEYFFPSRSCTSSLHARYHLNELQISTVISSFERIGVDIAVSHSSDSDIVFNVQDVCGHSGIGLAEILDDIVWTLQHEIGPKSRR